MAAADIDYSALSAGAASAADEALDALLTIRPGAPDARMAKLVVFDLDKTLVSNDTTVSWTNFLYDVGMTTDDFYRRLNEQMVKDYRAGTLDIRRYYEQAAGIVAGIPLSTLIPLVDRFVEERVTPLIYPAGFALIRRCRALSIRTCILSASAAYLVRRVALRFGLDEEAALGVEFVEKNGALTTELSGEPTFQEGKVARIAEWMAQRGLSAQDLLFYTDSRNDLPLCRAAADACLVNPDPVLEAAGVQAHWRVLRWRL